VIAEAAERLEELYKPLYEAEGILTSRDSFQPGEHVSPIRDAVFDVEKALDVAFFAALDAMARLAQPPYGADASAMAQLAATWADDTTPAP
jgi:hypothetical protein